MWRRNSRRIMKTSWYERTLEQTLPRFRGAFRSKQIEMSQPGLLAEGKYAAIVDIRRCQVQRLQLGESFERHKRARSDRSMRQIDTDQVREISQEFRAGIGDFRSRQFGV